MTRIIGVISGKGGVGKTTSVSNLAVALSKLDKSVLVIDGNLSGANLGQHFGVEFEGTTLNDVMNEDAFITQALYKREGVSVIPASILDFEGDHSKLKYTLLEYVGDKDFILVDAAAGVHDEVEEVIRASDEVVLVTEPETPSLTNAVGAKRLSDSLERDITGVIVNNVRHERNEVETPEIENILDAEVLGEVPEHRHVRDSISENKPVVSHRPNSKPSKAYMEIAYELTGEVRPQSGVMDKFKDVLDRVSSVFPRL